MFPRCSRFTTRAIIYNNKRKENEMEPVELVNKVVTSVSGMVSCGSEIKVECKIGAESKGSDGDTSRATQKDQIPTGEAIALEYTNRGGQLKSSCSAFWQWVLSMMPYVAMIWIAYIAKATLIAMKGTAQ